MEIKVGDKVKILSEGGNYENEIGIVGRIKPDKIIVVYVLNYDCALTYDVEELELIEIAYYIPIPKHHKGDIRWYEYKKGEYEEAIIISERFYDLTYRCYIERTGDICYYLENQLLLEKPKGGNKE